jgi:hypothetical protein
MSRYVVLYNTEMYYRIWFDLIWFIVFNATFSNISAIWWRPVLVVEEAERTTDQEQATGKLYHLRLRVEYTLFFVIYNVFPERK